MVEAVAVMVEAVAVGLGVLVRVDGVWETVEAVLVGLMVMVEGDMVPVMVDGVDETDAEAVKLGEIEADDEGDAVSVGDIVVLTVDKENV